MFVCFQGCDGLLIDILNCHLKTSLANPKERTGIINNRGLDEYKIFEYKNVCSKFLLVGKF